MATNIKNSTKINRIIIVGAGIGGLATAAAIAPLCQEIHILEKDTLPDDPAVRKSIAQGAHLHSLLMGGLESLEQLFPNIKATLIEAGAAQLRAGLDQQIHENGRWLPQRDLNATILAQSRYLLEHTIRQYVSNLDSVQIHQHTHVEKLLLDTDLSISAVQYRQPGETQAKLISGDIVIDASGRSGRFARQLAEQIPDLNTVLSERANIVYASAFLKKPTNWLNHKENILITAESDCPRGGALIDIENDQWCVSLNCRNGDPIPTAPEEWKQFARTLPALRIWERIIDAPLLGTVRLFKKPEITWRRFDKASQLPGNYFPVGDVITSIDPTFGQGMTVAIKHAIELASCLTLPEESQQQQYIENANRWSELAWRASVNYKTKLESSKNSNPKSLALLQTLSNKRHQQLEEDHNLHLALFRKAQMLI